MLKIHAQNKGGGSGMVVMDERLCLTKDRQRLVPHGDPEAAELWCRPGSKVAAADLDRLMSKVETKTKRPRKKRATKES